MTFIIELSRRQEILDWCSSRMTRSHDYNWFPFYETAGVNRQDAFRLDIYKEADITAFVLIWGYLFKDM